MKRFALSLLLLLSLALPAAAQTYYDVGVDLPEYPEMQPIPESPVYYAPGVDSNYFFYDGAYWDYYNDGWYSSPWYNGPWEYVDPVYVPTYILWVPIVYYHHPHSHWRGWDARRPPHWSQHWGRDWQARHNAVYAGRSVGNVQRAPLPQYQQRFNRQNYPRGIQQSQLHGQFYNYQPREMVTRQAYQNRGIGMAQNLQHSQGQAQGQGHHGENRNPAAR